MEKTITLPNMVVFFLLPEIARSGTSDEVVSSRACKASVATDRSRAVMTEPMPRTPIRN